MSKTIWKYPLSVGDLTDVEMPHDSKILCVQKQFTRPCIWVELNPEADVVKRSFRIFGTGHLIPDDEQLQYIGTFQVADGNLVFHLYERI